MVPQGLASGRVNLQFALQLTRVRAQLSATLRAGRVGALLIVTCGVLSAIDRQFSVRANDGGLKDVGAFFTTEGVTQLMRLAGGRKTIRTTGYAYEVSGSAPGQVVKCTASVPGDVEDPCAGAAPVGGVKTDYTHSEGYLTAMSANDATINTVEPHRGQQNWAASNDSVSETTSYDLKTGLPTTINTTGGTDSGEQTGSATTIEYRRARPGARDRAAAPRCRRSRRTSSVSSGRRALTRHHAGEESVALHGRLSARR